MSTVTLDRGPTLAGDDPTLRPSLGATASTRHRLLISAAAAATGAAVALAGSNAGISVTSVLLMALVAAACLLTAVAANWSTCGLSVAGVVAAPKQAGRPGGSSPMRRLGLHAAGSLLTGIPTGAAFGMLGGLLFGGLSLQVALGAWALLAAGYGLHELGIVRMPAPMRREQLPRHWRRTMEPRKVSFLFGAIIGPGFLIFIRSSAYYLLVLGVMAVGSPAWGAVAFAVVSLGRCGPSTLAILHTRRGGSMPEFLALSLRIDRAVQSTTGAALVALGVFTTAMLLL